MVLVRCGHMNYTAKRLEELLKDLNFCRSSLESKMPNVAALPLELPDIQEDIYHTVLKLAKIDIEVENVLKGIGLGPKTKVWKDYFDSETITRKKNLILGAKMPYSSEILEKLILFSGVKIRVLETLILGYENGEKGESGVGAETAKIKSIKDSLPLCIREGEGIYRRGTNVCVIKYQNNRQYLFLEGCIEMCSPDYRVRSTDIYSYLVANSSRLPKFTRNIENKKPAELWPYVRQCFYGLQKGLKGKCKIEEFLELETYSTATLKWKPEKVS